jgi:hypothetical protein
MLGEKIGEEQGKITGLRVLSVDWGIPKTEVTFQSQGTILGINYTNIGTYNQVSRPNGMVSGDGRGVITTVEGEVATWSGQGIGIPGEQGAISFRGALYIQTQSEKLARLNRVVVVYEFEADADMALKGILWEWK